MRSLTIAAVNRRSARGFLDALTDAGLDAELRKESDGTYCVEVRMDGADRDIHRALSALEEHVTARASGPARLELDGRSYTLEAVPDASFE